MHRLGKSYQRRVIQKVLLVTGLLFVLAAPTWAASSANFRVQITPGPRCYDGQDNDNDGKIDFPADPGCSSTGDNSETDNTPAGAGGGGVTAFVPVTSVSFSGRAYPDSTITLLKDAQVAAATVAGPDAKFQITLSGLSAGSYVFSLYSEDQNNRRSTLISFPVTLSLGASTGISDLFFAPTIALDKQEVRRGDNLAIFGTSVPAGNITINVNSEQEFFLNTKADGKGFYLYNFDTSPLANGTHSTQSKAAANGDISPFGPLVTFTVGNQTVETTATSLVQDVNNDGKINLIDFSIVAYWYKRPLDEAVKSKVDFNGDGQVNLVDLSIMAYYWTG